MTRSRDPLYGRGGPAEPSGPVAAEHRRERRAERIVALSFGVTMVAGVGLLVVYVLGGAPQIEGVLLFLALGGLGFGIVLWSQELMPVREIEEARPPLGADPAAREALADVLADEGTFSRRKLLVRTLAGALAGLAAAAAIPILSLGPAPGGELFQTPWRRGLRLVDAEGKPVTRDELGVGSIATVFPEGSPGSADGQTVLIHVEPGLLQLEGEAATWTPEGFVAYSKVCTHAGCPVGLYRAEEHRLICPCHQSTFDVLRGALPTFGPAARPLPQLPIQLQPDGTFVALGDFPEPVGPSFWNMTWRQ